MSPLSSQEHNKRNDRKHGVKCNTRAGHRNALAVATGIDSAVGSRGGGGGGHVAHGSVSGGHLLAAHLEGNATRFVDERAGDRRGTRSIESEACATNIENEQNDSEVSVHTR